MPFKKNSFFQIPRIAVASVFAAIFICLLVLCGWLLNIPLLQNFNPAWPAIKANTAIGILFSGISLFLFIKKKNRLALFFAVLVFLLSTISFGEHIFKFNAHIDELLFIDKGTPTEQNHGRIPLLASVVLMLTSISLFIYPSEKKWVQKAWQFLIILVFTLCFAGFIGALLNTGQFFKSKNLAAFSIPATLAGLLMIVGIVSSKPDSRILTVFQSDTLAAKASLKGIFFIIVILIAIGWLCLKGVYGGLFSAPMGFVIMIATFTISFLMITLSGVRRLNQSENRLIASEKNLRHVLSSTADVFYVIDRKYSITLINEMAERNLTIAWGKPVKAGANILELIPDNKSEPIHQSFEKVFRGEKIEYELHQSSWPDLPEWVSVSYKPVIDNDGTVIGAYIVTKDITKSRKAEEELKQSNNRFELISRTTNDAIWEWDLETGQLWSNETHQQLYGLSMADPVPGERMWVEKIHPEDKEKILNKQKSSLLSDKNVFISEYRFNVEGKGYRNIYDRCYIVRNKEGKATRMMGSMVDVTEQKRIEDELRKSEERYRSVIEQATDSIMITDEQGTFIDINSGFCKRFGYRKEELIGSNIAKVIDPIQLKNDPVRFDLLLAGQSIFRERRMLHKNGTIIEVEANVKMLPDGRILAIARDIAERKRAEEELRRSEERYRSLVENATEALVVFDVGEKKFVSVSESAAKLFKMSKEELLKIGPVEVSPEYQPNGRLSVEYAMEKLDETIAGHKPSFEWMHRDKDGKLIPCEIWLVRLPAENQILIRGTIIDISERKKAEELIAKEKELSDSIINSLPGIFFLRNLLTEEILRWNKNFETVLNYTSEEIAKNRLYDFIAEEDRKSVKEEMERSMKKGSGAIETHIVTKAGLKIPYFLSGLLINYENQPCLLGTGIDISDRKKAEEEVQRSYIAIRQLTEHLQNIREEERTHIAREIHDELGQQLTVLKMDASWLNKKFSSSDSDVKEKLRSLLELLDATVRSVRRISSELRPSLLDDMGLAAAMEWHLKEFEKRAAVKIQFTMPETELILPNTIKTGLFRIFQESLTNVARHAGAKEVKIDLRQKNGQIELRIQDDGKGFDKEKAANKKTLGILGMKERSFMMGGSYNISSTLNEGTVVVVSVPY